MSASARLHAPPQDGAVLAEPGLEQIGAHIAENCRRLAEGPTLAGRPWAELRAHARRTALQAAEEYLEKAGEPVPPGGGPSLLVAGHQPELFHPGVWIKNFALQGLARRHGACALNLIVDNDTLKTAALHLPVLVPSAARGEPLARRIQVPFDHWAGEVPFEERVVRDEGLFATLAQRARQPWPYAPLLDTFWPEVLRQARRTPLAGERLAAARRTFERRWGCHNRELPVSGLCGTEPFTWFTCHLLANLPTFQGLHNRLVREYRQRHDIRSPRHPVPDLAAQGDWLEAPFWAWRRKEQRRSRLFVRRTASSLELRAGAQPWPALAWPAGGDLSPLAASWSGLARAGLLVRSRALTTTLYARLFLADLFVHGIGGGKYDELTDQLIAGFYGLVPPTFLVLSATLLLPLPRYPADPENCRRLGRLARDFYWNSQRHLGRPDGDDAARHLVKEKQEWIDRRPGSREERLERFARLRGLTAQLRMHTAARAEEMQARWVRCRQEVEANQVLARRDYAFCLYPEAQLRPFCTSFLALA